jgi:SAM-dependent methyltransferase
MAYTFGTTEIAARRLESIAAFFNPLAERFIGAFLPGSPRVALDLGCGPGFTTDMLARASRSHTVCGMDNSPAFLDMARKKYPRYQFIQHDVTVTPFPVRADVAYVRFLLSHLADPAALVNRWLRELAPGGLLFIEELEDIHTRVPVFRQYLDGNVALLRRHGTELFVGPTLAQASYAAQTLCNQTVLLPVPNAVAAGWFLRNVQTIWQCDPAVEGLIPPAQRTHIADELQRLAASPDDTSAITWSLRRLALLPPTQGQVPTHR